MAGAERAGRELIALSPYRENGYRWLMEALDRTGNTAEALRIYEQLRALLRDELGVAPSGETVRLHDELLRGISRAGGGW
jgi:DNA-binding SARP family transcriptional activator